MKNRKAKGPVVATLGVDVQVADVQSSWMAIVNGLRAKRPRGYSVTPKNTGMVELSVFAGRRSLAIPLTTAQARQLGEFLIGVTECRDEHDPFCAGTGPAEQCPCRTDPNFRDLRAAERATSTAAQDSQ